MLACNGNKNGKTKHPGDEQSPNAETDKTL